MTSMLAVAVPTLGAVGTVADCGVFCAFPYSSGDLPTHRSR